MALSLSMLAATFSLLDFGGLRTCFGGTWAEPGRCALGGGDRCLASKAASSSSSSSSLPSSRFDSAASVVAGDGGSA